MGDYAKAEPLYQQALQIFKKVLGPEHPLTVTTLNNLVFVYETMGDYAKAEPLLRQVLQIRQKVLGPEHPDTATSLNNLAELYQARGDYAKAEPLYQQALQIFKKVLGPDTLKLPQSSTTWRFSMRIWVLTPRPNRSCSKYSKSGKRCSGRNTPTLPWLSVTLRLLYAHIGDLAKVEPLFQQALQIFKKVLGPEHPATVTSLNNLAELYDHMGDYAKAEPLLQQVLQIRQKVLGPEHPDTALSLNNLALLYYEMGDYAKAEPLLQQVLEIRQKVLGPEHPSTAASLENLALVKIDVGQIVQAKSLAQLSAKAHLASLSNILSFASEQQRLAFEDTIHPYALFPILKGSEVDLASAVLRYKGVVLDSIIEDRLVAEASKQSEDRNLVGRLAADKRQLGRLLLQTPNKPSGETKKKIENLEQEVDEIQERLARHVSGLGQARRALSVTLEQVQTTIPKDGVLIEYLRYGHYLGKGKWEQRYGAITLASSGQPSWIPLGDAPEIEAQVQRYRDIIEKLAQWSGNQEELSFSEQKLSKNLQKLYAELWQPIEETLSSDIKRVIISPDGQLNFVSFATLLKPDKHFVAEKYLIQYVASGRDLVREVRPPSSSQVFVFANPEFNSFPSTLVADADPAPSASELGAKKDPAPSAFVPEGSRGIELRDMVDMRFDPLEGTQEESDELCKKFKQWQWDSKTFDREIATKAELLKVQSPYILHLATHGFFAPEGEGSEAGLEKQAFSSVDRNLAKAKFFKNPMHRSGLALTGANVTLRAWRDGKPLPLENDGILTAEDVSTLDLRGTWLVTLSACDTGSGEAKAGEGVMGLRRGFIQAGAENLLMTLWSINDTMTVEIMSDFYEAAHESGNAPQALAEVQRNWLVKLRKEKGLARAVSIAGPFIMSSQGKP